MDTTSHTWKRVRTAHGKGFIQRMEKGLYSAWKRVGTAHGKPGKIREILENSESFLTIFTNNKKRLRENSGNIILSNIFDEIGGALRIYE